MNETEHQELRELIGVHAMDLLDGPDRTRLLAHLDGCAACRAELAGVLPVVSRLRGIDPSRLDETPIPPPNLGASVLAEIRAERTVARRRIGQRRLVLVAAACIAAIAIGFGSAWVIKPNQVAPTEAVAVQAPETADVSASASVIAHTWGMEIVLVATGFDRGQPYQVMVADRAGTQISAGAFVGTGSTEMTCNLTSYVLRDEATGFSVVDSSGAVVLASSL